MEKNENKLKHILKFEKNKNKLKHILKFSNFSICFNLFSFFSKILRQHLGRFISPSSKSWKIFQIFQKNNESQILPDSPESALLESYSCFSDSEVIFFWKLSSTGRQLFVVMGPFSREKPNSNLCSNTSSLRWYVSSYLQMKTRRLRGSSRGISHRNILENQLFSCILCVLLPSKLNENRRFWTILCSIVSCDGTVFTGKTEF